MHFQEAEMKQVTTTQERLFSGDIPLPVNLSMAIAIHILDPIQGLCQDPRDGKCCVVMSHPLQRLGRIRPPLALWHLVLSPSYGNTTRVFPKSRSASFHFRCNGCHPV